MGEEELYPLSERRGEDGLLRYFAFGVRGGVGRTVLYLIVDLIAGLDLMGKQDLFLCASLG